MTGLLYGTGRSVLFASVLVIFVTLGTGTAAAQSAPDCSTVTYQGTGSDSDPYSVSSVSQLQCMGNPATNTSLSDTFFQTSDIDGSNTSSWNGGEGFDPIGQSAASREAEFEGVFDGRGYSITNLTIDRVGDAVGVFSLIGNEGTVTNVTVSEADVEGSSTVGALVGLNRGGTVRNSHASGSVSGESEGAGGLVGVNQGGSVYRSHSSASVSGSRLVGGLVGASDGTVSESYSSGNVSGSVSLGGLVGYNAGTVSDSYSLGSVNGTTFVGGLAGTNGNDTVSESYAAGSVDGSEDVGGLIGAKLDGSVRQSYWDMNTTGQSSSEGGVGLTTEEMTDSDASDSMRGLNFTQTWETRADDYPVLAWQTEESGAESDVGTEGEGLPGFTFVTAMLALLTIAAMAAIRKAG